MAVAHVRTRLARIIAARLVVSSLLLGSAVAFGLANHDTFPVAPLVLLIAVTYALNIAYLATLRAAVRHPAFIDLQFAFDAVLVAACIYLTGGITSNFSSLSVLPIIASSTVRGRRGAMQVAALSATLYVGVVTAQYLDVGMLSWTRWRPVATTLPSLVFAQYTVVVNLGGLLGVALLAGSLAERLRSARAGLEDASYEIADLRAFNDHVIDSLSAGLITTDAAGRVITLNRAAGRIVGAQQRDVVGKDVQHVLQLEVAQREALPSLANERSRMETSFHPADREPLELGLSVSTLQFPEGTNGFLIVFQDITEFKRLEREARLQQRLAAVGEMAAGIAHEIRNPLAAMTGSIEVLRQELPLADEHGQLMEIVLRESERLNETIRLFLAYARPHRQASYRLDIRSVVRDAAAALRSSVDMREDHTVLVEIPDEALWYEGDETELRQVLWSLGTNGLRAMPVGGELTMAAWLDSKEGGAGELVISVRDRGCGIPRDQLDDVFQPFHGTFRKGTGLGLAIVHRIVSDYGGRIHVSSTVGEGTTISARLPLPPASSRPASRELPPGRTA
jgi:two-component system sensor histidine kinase PilS (NtrC family)